MEVTPVIDLLGGRAVHAQGGLRSEYKPLVSRLCRNPSAPEVAAALLGLFPFRSLYVADLDAIQGRAPNLDTLRRLAARMPETTLWLDAGNATTQLASALAEVVAVVPVLGTETLADPSEPARAPLAIVSLDYRDGRLLGELTLASLRATLPERVILMSLNRVGARTGPDLELLREIRAQPPRLACHVAGGVRGPEDLTALATVGAAGALVATALHNGAIGAEALDRITRLPEARNG
ncbi:MAG: HisA/HisF-related TIM barrel protein [Thiotrichales bacterium]